MRGTLVCAVTEGDESDEVVALGADLSERLGLRLVVAHAVDGIDAIGHDNDNESLTIRASRQGAERRLQHLASQHGVAHRAERRVAVGDPAAVLGQIAAEEAADVIVVGARARGWRGRLDSRLATELDTETPIPILIAPPRGRRPGKRATKEAPR
jgi:nucleotide-binding universal stress UspA family protein